jgi:predicted DNA-binding transcriptional regulator AlpA
LGEISLKLFFCFEVMQHADLLMLIVTVHRMAEMHEYEAPKLLREAQILELIPVSRATFRRWISSGTFPPGFKVSERIVMWPSEVVHQWISDAQK